VACTASDLPRDEAVRRSCARKNRAGLAADTAVRGGAPHRPRFLRVGVGTAVSSGNRSCAARQAVENSCSKAACRRMSICVTKCGMRCSGRDGRSRRARYRLRSRKDQGINSEISDALCEAGRPSGQKTGRATTSMKAARARRCPDPQVEKLTTRPLQRLAQAPASSGETKFSTHDVPNDTRAAASIE